MDASGHIAAPIAGYAPQRRMVSLRSMAFGGAVLGWLVAFAIVVSVLVASTRDAVRDEARSALRLASAAATLRLPTAFERRDLMREATAIAARIDALRHVSAELRDSTGRPVALPAEALASADVPAPAPGWFAALIAPEPERELIAVTQYPNLLGMLEIGTDPRDEIAEAWHDLRLILPLLAATALVAVGVTMAITSLLLRRLQGLGTALDGMRAGALDRRAPHSRVAEIARLGEGVNALAAHLADERAENRRLQGRMMTLAEAERARIASDLHDGIGPRLFALQAAIAQAMPEVRWRLASSYPKSLDTLYGGGEVFAKYCAEVTDNKLISASNAAEVLSALSAAAGGRTVVIATHDPFVLEHADEVLALCDETVRIPMSPRCESLNAAVAASVLLWEAYR